VPELIELRELLRQSVCLPHYATCGQLFLKSRKVEKSGEKLFGIEPRRGQCMVFPDRNRRHVCSAVFIESFAATRADPPAGTLLIAPSEINKATFDIPKVSGTEIADCCLSRQPKLPSNIQTPEACRRGMFRRTMRKEDGLCRVTTDDRVRALSSPPIEHFRSAARATSLAMHPQIGRYFQFIRRKRWSPEFSKA